MNAKHQTPRDQDVSYVERDSNILLPAAEALRIAAAQPAPPSGEPKSGDEGISLFWRVFGGAILSVAFLFLLNVYQGFNNSFQDLRNEVSKLREQSTDFVKSGDYTAKTTAMWNRLQEFNKLNADLTVAANKLATLEQQLAAAEKERREMQIQFGQLVPLKDRVAVVEEVRRALDALSRDVTALTGTVQALEKREGLNEKWAKEGEAERREMIREMQQLRERIAKLEGSNESKPKDKAAEPKPVVAPPRDPAEVKD